MIGAWKIMTNQCPARDGGGVRCLHDETHNNGEYAKHKGSHPTTTRRGFKGVKIYHWTVKESDSEQG